MDLPEISLHRADPGWETFLPHAEALSKTVLEAACARLTDGRKTSLTIALESDARVRELNRIYRDKDKPTNILSFPDGEADEDGRIYLGDLILARETLDREAKTQNISPEDHFSHLVLHGFLHLLGYDHEEEARAQEMEALEIRILTTLNIENPYRD